MINREVCQKPKQDWNHHRRRLDLLTSTRIGKVIWWCHAKPWCRVWGTSGIEPMFDERIFAACPDHVADAWTPRRISEFWPTEIFSSHRGNAWNSPFFWSFRKLDEMRWECLWLVHNFVRWLRLCSLRTNWPPDLWFLTTLQPLLLYSPRVPRRRCLPGKSTSGWTTRRCLVRASFRENSFSSVQSAHLSLSFLLLWIVSSCLVKS